MILDKFYIIGSFPGAWQLDEKHANCFLWKLSEIWLNLLSLHHYVNDRRAKKLRDQFIEALPAMHPTDLQKNVFF